MAAACPTPSTRSPRWPQQGATLLINISASPFWAGKEEIRYRLLSEHARRHGLPFVFVNQVGANDELIFDGRSLFLDAAAEPRSVFPPFAEHVRTVDTAAAGGRTRLPATARRSRSIYEALVLGMRDYMRKTRLPAGRAWGCPAASIRP